jgi:nucleoside-diphosphate-sugar epimerase
MLILITGAKGGVGTTSLAQHLVREVRGVGLDLADGQLAARLERPTWSLARPTFATAQARREAIDRVVERRITLLWTPECVLASGDAWAFVGAVADRTVVVADGGIEPSQDAARLAQCKVIVAADGDVARYHTGRLQRRWPDALVLTLELARSRGETKEAARQLAAQLFAR